jgi:hypothetical protein
MTFLSMPVLLYFSGRLFSEVRDVFDDFLVILFVSRLKLDHLAMVCMQSDYLRITIFLEETQRTWNNLSDDDQNM